MRKTEAVMGLCAGCAGIVIAVLSLFSLLPYLTEYSGGAATGAIICLAANAVGLAGALTIQKSNVAGAAMMALCLIGVMIYGFPWQSLPAVVYIISVVMAVVPVKAVTKD